VARRAVDQPNNSVPRRELAKAPHDTGVGAPSEALANRVADAGVARAAPANASGIAEAKAADRTAPAPEAAPKTLGKLLAAPQSLQPNRLDEVVASGAAGPPRAKSLAEPAAVEISLTDAIQRLGGSLRLIEGLVPRRLEAVGNTVRVVYPLGTGEVVLSQRLVDGRVAWTLRADPAVSADSLAALRARVRE
jgi:hypothetical protein